MKKNNLNVLLLVLLMIAAIYIADGFIFKSIAVWLFYLLPVIIAAWNIPELLAYSMNMLSSLLILFDLYSNHAVFSKTEIFNRLIGIAVLWTVGIISVKFNRTKTKLEESEILLSSAQELAHLGSLKLNTRTKELFFTEESKRIFGFDPKPGSVDFDLAIECIHPEDRHLISESLDRNISGKQTEEIHYRLAFPDGSVKYIYSITKPIFDKKGEV
ncbi:MAG: PAS domain-containing protein, partial [Bacillota bacterium]